MKLWQTGNVGSHNVDKLIENPKDGYKTYDEAKLSLYLLKSKGIWALNQPDYSFTIMELFYNE